ncbi:MAG: hypothetical protein ACTSUD_12500 [Alphaproteobacteria bacterium]
MKHLTSVGIELQHSQKSLMLGLARRLKDEHGSRIHAYVRSEAERKGFVAAYPSPPWDTITVSDVLSRAIADAPPAEALVVERARGFEARFDESLHRIILAMRHFNRGYSPGSFAHPRAPHLAKAGYIPLLHALNEQLSFWDREIADKGLTLIVDADKGAACMARANGVAYRWFTFGRYKGHRAWATDEYQTNPLIEPAYRALESWGPAQLSEVYLAAQTKYREFYRRLAWHRLIAKNSRAFARYCYWRLTGAAPARNVNPADYFRGPIRLRRSIARLRRLARTGLDDLGDRAFAYLPLQKEPEVALLQAAPEHTNQQAVVMAVSRELPAGVTLAVKEHTFAIGRRPAGFYEQIAALPNVRWVALDEDPIALVSKAAVTITIAGTAAHEAAVLGRPAIVFGSRMSCAFLDHVMTVEADGDLRRHLCRVFDGDIDLGKAGDDGARYEAAVARATFDLGEAGAWVTDRGNLDPAAIDAAYGHLLRTFETRAPKLAAAKRAARKRA